MNGQHSRQILVDRPCHPETSKFADDKHPIITAETSHEYPMHTLSYPLKKKNMEKETHKYETHQF